MKNVIVTGSSGFVGQHVVEKLKHEKINVIGIDIKPPLFVHPDVFYEVNVLDKDALVDIFHRTEADTVFHLAAKSTIQDGFNSPQETFSTNYSGTINVLDAASACSPMRVVYASTDKVYGMLPGNAEAYDESMPLDPLKASAYDCSKAEADREVQERIKKGADCIITRFCNLYGPYDLHFSRIVPHTVQCALHGKPVTLNIRRSASGSEEDFFRDMLYIDDLASALITVASLPRLCEDRIFNFGGEFTSMSALIQSILKHFDPVQICRQAAVGNEIPVQRMNDTKAHHLLGFKHRDLESGIAETVHWWKDYIQHHIAKEA